ncbi:MAG: hypothetical protein P8X73_18625 [Ignavibacteriaceae bacterium]
MIVKAGVGGGGIGVVSPSTVHINMLLSGTPGPTILPSTKPAH